MKINGACGYLGRVEELNGKLFAVTCVTCEWFGSGDPDDYEVDGGNDYCVFPCHRLADGRIVAITINQEFKFSDGTVYVPQKFEVEDTFFGTTDYLERLKSLRVTDNKAKTKIVLDGNTYSTLCQLGEMADIVLVSSEIIKALRNMECLDDEDLQDLQKIVSHIP